jgi:hypothetical protein
VIKIVLFGLIACGTLFGAIAYFRHFHKEKMRVQKRYKEIMDGSPASDCELMELIGSGQLSNDQIEEIFKLVSEDVGGLSL